MNKYITFLFIILLYKKNDRITSKNIKLHNKKKSIISSHNPRETMVKVKRRSSTPADPAIPYHILVNRPLIFMTGRAMVFVKA